MLFVSQEDRSTSFALSLALVVCTLATAAHAQWSVSELHIPGTANSQAWGTPGTGATQVGSTFSSGFTGITQQRAYVWSGSAASAVSLHPVGVFGSEALASHGNQQGGWVGNPVSQQSAVLWTGSADSLVVLGQGSVNAMTNGMQGGQSNRSAAIWQGTPESYVNLSAPGSISSSVYGLENGRQVGSFTRRIPLLGDIERPCIWNSTAASFQLLPGFVDQQSFARATGISGNQIVGFETGFFGGSRAILWDATTLQPTMLLAPNANSAGALAVSNGMQVGFVEINNNKRASLWSGSTASWIDLHSFAPAGFGATVATGIAVTATTIEVTGYGVLPNGQFRALFWSQPIPSAGSVSAFILAGAMAARRRR